MKDDLINDVPAAKSRRRRTVWSDQGDELNVDRAMRGDWDQAWRKAQRQWTNGPSTVEIAAHFGGNCDKTSDQLFWGGAAALVICDILEDAGYNVAISGYQLTNQSARHDGKGDAGWGRNNLSVDKVLIKQAGEPLREDAVASVVCSAGVFRTLGFRAIMGADVFNVDGGLGSTSSWQIAEPMLREAGRWPEEAIKINSVYSRETAIAEIKRVIKMVQDQAATEK